MDALNGHPLIVEMAKRCAETEARTGRPPDAVWIDHGRVQSLPAHVREAMIGAAVHRVGGLRVNGVPVKVHTVLDPGPRDPNAPMWSQRPRQ